jgi:hypothetical protein
MSILANLHMGTETAMFTSDCKSRKITSFGGLDDSALFTETQPRIPTGFDGVMRGEFVAVR